MINQLSGERPSVFERRKAISELILLCPLISRLKVEGATLSFAATVLVTYVQRFKIYFSYKFAWMWWVIHTHK